jgi:hypothetical protein
LIKLLDQTQSWSALAVRGQPESALAQARGDRATWNRHATCAQYFTRSGATNRPKPDSAHV